MIDYDLELRRHDAAFRRALSISRTDNVIDIGCGSGETTRDAARSASEGSALGIDILPNMIERARALAKSAGPLNVAFECADVEQYALSTHHYDLAISRYGTMFFSDPIAAFTNIHQALTHTGRLVMIVWQSREQNEWAAEIPRALANNEVIANAAPDTWQPFSLGEQSAVTHLLSTAGFTDITFDEVHEPVFYGADVASAFAFVSKFLLVQNIVNSLHATDREPSLERLRALLTAHRASDGVWFDARAWLVAARCS